MPKNSIPIDACTRMVESAAHSCQPVARPPIEAAHPNWDAIAVSLTSQSNAIAWGALAVTVIIAIAGLAWGRIITLNAEREAREMAKTFAEAYIAKWLAEEAPGIIRERVDFILDATLGSGNDAKAADDLGEQAG